MILHYKIFIHLFLIVFNSIETHAYRILAISPFNSRSHNNMIESVAKSLAKRGHQIDVITHFELKNPPKNYKTIINLAGTTEELVNNWTISRAIGFRNEDFIGIVVRDCANNLCELISLEKMQRFIKNPPNDPPYDLVITEALAANCYIGFGHLLKVPVITVTALIEFSWHNENIGNPMSSAFAASLEMEKAQMSTFLDRLINTFLLQYNKYKFYRYTENVQTEIMRKYLSPDIPNIREIEKTVALTLVNTHYSIFGIRPMTPAFISIAGIQIEQNESKLSPDLQKWMDESKNGIIYFTLGSMVVIDDLPKETLLAIYSSFAKLAPMRVLMKIMNKDNLPEGLPKNVMTLPWIPQIPVLRHNNTRIFITHGGLNSVMEATYFAVPMIGLPLFGDQQLNINLLTKTNMALRMDIEKITEKSLDEALNSLLHDPKYRKAAERTSHLFRDRPMSATDTAIFWTEYIIRNGADSLRSPAVDLYWWQVELLDIYGFLIICLFTIIYIIFLFLKTAICVIRNILGSKSQFDKKKE